MSEFKGTKGKWVVKHLDDIFIKNEFGEQICEMPAKGIIRYETWRENAQLISKAPEMLEMLKYFTDFPDEDFESNFTNEKFTFTVMCQKMKDAKELIQQATTI